MRGGFVECVFLIAYGVFCRVSPGERGFPNTRRANIDQTNLTTKKLTAVALAFFLVNILEPAAGDFLHV
jgi:hypothetical protein